MAMSSTHIAMLDAIGEVRCITGVSGIDYISNPDIQARRDSIGDVGYEGNINYELLPRSILTFDVGAQWKANSKNSDIPFMYVGDYLEESPRQGRMDGSAFRSHRKTRRVKKISLPQSRSDTTP